MIMASLRQFGQQPTTSENQPTQSATTTAVRSLRPWKNTLGCSGQDSAVCIDSVEGVETSTTSEAATWKHAEHPTRLGNHTLHGKYAYMVYINTQTSMLRCRRTSCAITFTNEPTCKWIQKITLNLGIVILHFPCTDRIGSRRNFREKPCWMPSSARQRHKSDYVPLEQPPFS